jgi:putative SOS response-associated peptidase YedK
VCANYHPVTSADRMLAFFGVERPIGEVPVDIFPQLGAPFIWRRPDIAELEREAQLGRFGLIPHWTDDLALGRRTYNARSETVAEKPAFRDSWRRGRRCIVPAEAIYEPNYESGKPVRWRISRRDGQPLGIAGLWGWWRDPRSGQEVLSFTMLTINADHHELMRRFHKPGEEKRMVVILEEAEYDAWLDCPEGRMMSFMRPYPADRLEAEPFPIDPVPRPLRPPRPRRANDTQPDLDF